MENRCIIVSGGVFSPAPEQQPGAIRAIMKRANEEIPVKLFAVNGSV